MLACVISDLDGTLIDSFEASLEAYEKAFSVIGKDFSRETYKEVFGQSFEVFAERVNLDKKDWTKVRACKREFYPLFFNLIKVNVPLLRTIETLHKIGVKTALVSNGTRENVEAICRYFDLNRYFDSIKTRSDVKAGKPDPEIYLTVLKDLQVDATEAVAFEDSKTGVEAAQKAGIGVVFLGSY